MSELLKTVVGLLLVVVTMTRAQNFDTNFVELDSSKMIHTSDSHYAIFYHHFPNNWRSVSVNGDEVTIVTRDSQLLVKRYHALTADEKNSIEKIKNELTSIIRSGPFNVKSQTGFVKVTTFDKNGGSSVMGSGGSSASGSSSSSGGTSIQKTGKDSFIICKPDFPFNWHRVFVNDDFVSVVYKDSRTLMMPQSLMRSDEKAKMEALRQEVDKSSKATEKLTSTIMDSFKNPMDFVNKALGGIFGG